MDQVNEWPRDLQRWQDFYNPDELVPDSMLGSEAEAEHYRRYKARRALSDARTAHLATLKVRPNYATPIRFLLAHGYKVTERVRAINDGLRP